MKPTDIVVHYFLRDAEALPPGGGNWFLRNSELAVTLWIAYHRVIATMVDAAYAAESPSAPEAICSLYGFAAQIYCDFSATRTWPTTRELQTALLRSVADRFLAPLASRSHI